MLLLAVCVCCYLSPPADCVRCCLLVLLVVLGWLSTSLLAGPVWVVLCWYYLLLVAGWLFMLLVRLVVRAGWRCVACWLNWVLPGSSLTSYFVVPTRANYYNVCVRWLRFGPSAECCCRSAPQEHVHVPGPCLANAAWSVCLALGWCADAC